jgi:hypothetical protein
LHYRGVPSAKATTPERPRAIDDPQTIVESAPPQVIARWFVAKDSELVPSPEFERWKAEHARSQVGRARLISVTPTITKKENGWDLEIAFELRDGDRRRHPFVTTSSLNRGPRVAWVRKRTA